MADPTPARPKLRAALTLAAALAGAFLGGLLGLQRPGPVVPPAPQTAPAEAADPGAAGPPAAAAQGWVSDPAEVDAVKATLPQPVFSDTPAGREADGLPDHAYLWEAYVKLFARPPPVMDQNPVGSCVSFGSSRAFERSLAVEIVGGAPYEFKHLVEEVVYAGSRHEVGGDRIGRGDGSVGAWAAKFFTGFGGLPRGVYGKYDLTKYSPARCRQWGSPGAGVPDDLEPEVKKYPAGSASQVRTWAEAKKALANGYGVAVCSDVGFNKPGTRPGYVDPAARDANGVCRPNGSWGHCMALDGYHVDKATGKEYGHIENSWGPNAHRGPVGWGNPNTSGFWAESAVIGRMLAQGDSWAISSVKGFPRKKIDWENFDVSAAPVRFRPSELNGRRPEYQRPADRHSGLALAW